MCALLRNIGTLYSSSFARVKELPPFSRAAASPEESATYCLCVMRDHSPASLFADSTDRLVTNRSKSLQEGTEP